MEVSVRELKARLSEYLRRVAGGEELTVTSRGAEVARLLPPHVRRAKALSRPQLIERFRQLPGVRPGNGRRLPLPKPLARLGKRERTLAQMVSEDRG